MKTLLLMNALSLTACDPIRSFVIGHYPANYEPAAAGSLLANTHWSAGVPVFTNKDTQRQQVGVKLTPVLDDLNQPTDMVFFPGSNEAGFVLEKEGRLLQFDLSDGTTKPLASFDVLTNSEQGLLGVAFHPDFGDNNVFYLHRSLSKDGAKVGEISSWTLSDSRVTQAGVVFQVEQPYPNHNAGQIAFGPDGMLYVGMGDGGWRDDPHEHGQNGQTLLGSMLRVDVRTKTGTDGYVIPPDNPFVNDPAVADEAWAIGLRNPWKFSFAPDGRMVIADVGQNAFEEVSIASGGENLGWKTREGRHCFPARTKCSSEGLTDPIYEYPHEEGKSITGGYVATSNRIPAIQNHFVFGDFVSGRLWAIPLPANTSEAPVNALTLGQWPFLPSTFGRSADGTLFVADYGKGYVYRIDPA